MSNLLLGVLVDGPGIAAGEQIFQLTVAVFLASHLNLFVDQAVVSWPLHRSENSDRFWEFGVTQATEHKRKAGIIQFFVMEQQIVGGNRTVFQIDDFGSHTV